MSKNILYINLYGDSKLVDEFLNIIKAQKENENYFIEYNTTKGLFKFIFDNNINNPNTILYLRKDRKEIKSEIKNIEKSQTLKKYKNIIICSNQNNILNDTNARLFSEEIEKNKYHIITSFNTGLNKDLAFYYIIKQYLIHNNNLNNESNKFDFIDVKIIDYSVIINDFSKYSKIYEMYPDICIDKIFKDRDNNKYIKNLYDVVEEVDNEYKKEIKNSNSSNIQGIFGENFLFKTINTIL